MAGMVNPSETYTAWSIGEGAHEVTGLKPMLNPEEQVALLKAKGVSFERCGEEQAADALARRGTFVHLASCRRLFQKHASGDDRGKYVRLDFADLLALDALDDELRKAFLAVSQDVERLAKTSMVTRASRLDDEDGYGIVADFMRAQQRRYRSYIERDLSSRMSAGIVGDVYTGRIIGHYRDAMPVWAFLEVVTFGTALAFCLFCSERWDDAVMREEHYILKGVKAVRNCCSHGSCIVNGMDGLRAFQPGLRLARRERRRQQQDAPRQVKEPSYAAAPRDARDVRPIGRAGALSPFDGAAGRAARESSRHVRELRRPERVRVVPEVSGESH